MPTNRDKANKRSSDRDTVILRVVDNKIDNVQEALSVQEARRAEEEKRLEAKRLLKAKCQGKYAELLTRIHAPEDKRAYGSFKDHGTAWTTKYKGVVVDADGHWVYVAPYWYVWARNVRKEQRELEYQLAAERREEEWRLQSLYGDGDKARERARECLLEGLDNSPDTVVDTGGSLPTTERKGQTWIIRGTVRSPSALGISSAQDYECHLFFDRSTGIYLWTYMRIGDAEARLFD